MSSSARRGTRRRKLTLIAGLMAALVLSPNGHAEENRSSNRDSGASQRARPAALQGTLGSEVARLLATWGRDGQAERRRPRLLQRGESHPVYAPASFEYDCTTVAVVGPPNLSFVLSFGGASEAPTWPVPSVAGLAEVTRCGERRLLGGRISVRMRSPRGVVETIVAHTRRPPREARRILSTRQAGAAMPAPEVGTRPALGPLSDRIRQRVQSLRQRGPQSVRSRLLKDAEDEATFVLLEPGCHVLSLLAEQSDERPVDVDARLTTKDGSQLVASDETSAGDATLVACVAVADRYLLAKRATPSASAVALVQAHFDLPQGLPLQWGQHARARIAKPLLAARMFRLQEPPIESFLGVRGVTRSLLQLHPDRCYVVAAAAFRGKGARLSLAVGLGSAARSAASASASEAHALTFCAQGRDRALIEVQALGPAVAYLLAAWELAP